MKKYSETCKDIIISATCNACGKCLKVEDGIVKEGCCSYREMFGYFSEKDGQIHSFDLCEKCYDRIIGAFAIPVEIEQAGEML